MTIRFLAGLRWLALMMALGFAPWAMASGGGGGGGDDGEVELSGVVQALPASGLTGDWTVAGVVVHVSATTMIDQSDGAVGVGALVEVHGTRGTDGSLTATSIDVDRGVSGPPPPTAGPGASVHFSGAIDALPAGGLVGVWTVAGRSVIVLATTILQQEHGSFAVGAIVDVEGRADTAGAVTASSIELRSGGGTMPVPPGEDGVEIHGTIEALPAGGVVGTWTVTGQQVTVTATTILEADGGAFAVGDPVEVKGTVQPDGSIVATKIDREDGNGGGAPALEFTGAVEALPSGTSGVIGNWTVAGRTVAVTAATRISTADAALAVGVTVDVQGWLQADGSVLAHEIETRATAASAASGVAVEFFNARLGHFFLSANPAETALLDAGAFGGAWQRTGQSFAVGGTTSVCRFYGMPPRGPDSHFFTANAAECQQVMQTLAAWTFEGHAFSTTLPSAAGTCPSGTTPVHRLFNNPTTLAAVNHRFTTSLPTVAEMVAAGWIHEGVVMCAPQ